MKRFTYLVIIVLVLFLLGCPKPKREVQFENSEELALKMIEVIKTGNVETFEKYFIDSDDWKWIKKNSSYSKEEKDELTDEFIQNYLRDGVEQFLYQLEKIKETGIEWDKVDIIKIEHSERNENNLQMDDITVTIKYNEIEYALILQSCIKTDRGWVAGEVFDWYGRVNLFPTADFLFKTVIETLKINDFQRFKQCLVAPQEIEFVLSISDLNDEKKQEKIDNFMDEYWNVMLRGYEDLRALGISDGIDWSKIEITDIQTKVEEASPFKYTTANVEISFDEKKYSIKIRALQNPGGYWFLSDPMVWGGVVK